MIEILTTKFFDNWLMTLKDRAAKIRIQTRISRIAFSGNFGAVKTIGQGVYEIRIDYGPGYRIYYLKLKKVVIVLLCGGD